MLAAIRSRSSSSPLLQQWRLGFPSLHQTFTSAAIEGLLDLHEVERVLSDVKVIPANNHSEWADFMVLATGRSTWHVKNIAQALIYKAVNDELDPDLIVSKQKQKGAQRLVLPTVEGQEGGKWIVIDSGKVIVHALDENARAYYNLETLWAAKPTEKAPIQGKMNSK
ncbi:hypothetical protein ACLB2K_039569 [Fragaria x ananassa]